MLGYDKVSMKIFDMNGGVSLQEANGEIAAMWHFPNIIQHWTRKHAQAAYVPSLSRQPPPEYRFGSRVLLCEGTDLSLFLQAIAEGAVYYDPGIKIENASSEKSAIKRRSQFRISHNQLTRMYLKSDYVCLNS